MTAGFGWFVVTGPDLEVFCLRVPLEAGTALGLVTGVMRPLLSCLKRAMVAPFLRCGQKNEVQICRLQYFYYSTYVNKSQFLTTLCRGPDRLFCSSNS